MLEQTDYETLFRLKKAIYNENLDLFLQLLEHLPSTLQREGSILLTAAEFGTAVMVDALLQKRVHVNAKSHSGMTALHCALCSNPQEKAEKVAALLAHQADIHAKAAIHFEVCLGGYTTRDTTPLHLAVQMEEDVALIKMLLAHGADPEMPDETGRTALQYAQYAQREKKIALIPLLENAILQQKQGDAGVLGVFFSERREDAQQQAAAFQPMV